MQFQVPQFIEVEDKIFGPLTFKQFVYVIGGAGLVYLAWRVLPFFIAIPLMLAIAGFAAALAFLQYNGRPFIVALEAAFYFLIHPKLYLWNNQRPTSRPTAAAVRSASEANIYVPRLSESKLHELSWSLDIKERIAAGTASEDERGTDGVLSIRTADVARRAAALTH